MCSTWVPTVLAEIGSSAGDLLLGPAPDEQHQDLDLAGGQPAGAVGLAAHPVPGGIQHGP